MTRKLIVPTLTDLTVVLVSRDSLEMVQLVKVLLMHGSSLQI